MTTKTLPVETCGHNLEFKNMNQWLLSIPMDVLVNGLNQLSQETDNLIITTDRFFLLKHIDTHRALVQPSPTLKADLADLQRLLVEPMT